MLRLWIPGRSWPGGSRGLDPPAPEATREISANPVRNALGVGVSVVTRVPGGSDVGVIGHTLHAFCVWVGRKFAERQINDVKMHQFIFFYNAAHKREMWAPACALQNVRNLPSGAWPPGSHRGVSLGPAGGLPSQAPPPEIWTTPATETQLCPCFQPLQSYWKVGEFRISWNIQIWTFKLQATAAIWNDKFNGCNCKLFNLSEHVTTARCYQIYRQLQVLFITVSQHCSSVSQTLENTTCVSLDLISSWHR